MRLSRLIALFTNAAAITVVLILLCSILLRKNRVVLPSTGGKRAVASRSIIPAWNDGSLNICVSKEKVFSLGEDFFDGPIFVYPFADGRRFLCDYNYNTAILVFVVDLNATGTKAAGSSEWPPNGELRSFLEQGATNVVLQTKGMVRLPSYAELREITDYVSRATAGQIRTESLPYCDFGFYRHCVSKEFLLLDLATNRQSYWPL